jgi:ATP-binding cassette, subfamily B, bacterial
MHHSPLEHRYRGETPLRTLWYLLSDQRWRLLLAALIFVVKHSPVWLTPLLTANIINVVVQRRPLEGLWLNALALAVLLLQNVPLHTLYVRLLSLAVRAVELKLRSALCRRLQHLSIGYYTRQSAGVLQTKVLRDVEAIEQMLRQLYDGGLAGLSNIVGALVITALSAPWFVLFYLLVVPVAAFVVSALRNPLAQRNRQFRDEFERLSARVTEMTHLIPVTRAHGLEESELERVEQSLNRLQSAGLRLDATNGIFGALSWVTFNAFTGACLVVAAWVAYTGALPIGAGEVVMISGYFSSLTNAVMVLVALLPVISKGFESIHSIGEVLQAPDLEQNEGKIPVEAVNGEICFENVSFHYPDNGESALHDFSLTIAPGETIALVGASGAGKSTVLNLAIGFLRPSAGRILLDGRDMETLDLRTYRRFLSVVPQESILFDGSIRDNVTYGLGHIAEQTVYNALRDANALEFVEQLPDGMDTLVGERGARLSGGQKQRLAIARAIIRRPRILVLDEATSALDTASESLVQSALARLMKGCTTLVVAHRLSTIRSADRIVVLAHGRIVESGSHAALLAQGGEYSRLSVAT